MRILVVFCVVTLCMANAVFEANGMIVPGAMEDGIQNDCQVTAELSVMLLKMKAKTAPDQLLKAATTLLTNKGYKGSFGDTAFVASFYTGLALQMGAEVDPAMEAATPDDLESLKAEHVISCLEKAFEELNTKETSEPSPSPR